MRPAVLITGAAHRIGAVMAQAFDRAGWHVVIHFRGSRADAEALAVTLASAETIECDLVDGDAAVAMIEGLADRLHDWRVLINCAAVFRPDEAASPDPEIFAEAAQVNAATPARMSHAFLASARAKGGRRVIDLLDQKLLNPNPDFFSYSMAKHALAAAVRMQAMAATDPANRVYGLAPGSILPSHDQTGSEQQQSGRLNLLERLTAPEELADAALFLSQGWLASGETLYLDSGQHLLAQDRDVLFLARQ